MKPSLQLKISTQLTMTPQLQQAIRLLQLSTLDLQTEIQQAIESNPMLEVEDENEQIDEFDRVEERDGAEEELEAAADDGGDGAEAGTEEESWDDEWQAEIDALAARERENGSADDTAGSTELSGTDDLGEDRGAVEDDWKDDIPDDLSVDTSWDDLITSGPTLPANPDDDVDLDAVNAAPETLTDHLLWQLNLTHLSDTDRQIALLLIDAIDAQGFLRESVEAIVETIDDPEIEIEEVEAVLHLIQNFDPVGVGARDLAECLTVQLRQLPADTPHRDTALRLCRDHLEQLARRDYRALLSRLRVDETELSGAEALIRTLDPQPGTSVAGPEPEYVIPDVIVKPQGDGWTVELNGDALPRVRINPFYESAARTASRSCDKSFFSSNLQEARWFIKSLQSRNETLLKVATTIVERQRRFFQYGATGMVPMVLHDIAEAVGMHESTISRVTSRKYMHTPHGVFELKYFFSSHVGTVSGSGEVSSTAIRARIREEIDAENRRKPLSDSRIAAILAEKDNIKVARRTVAKYRESMGIPPSSQRKSLH